MSNEYGRIHTDGSRSGGQPVLLPCPVPWCNSLNVSSKVFEAKRKKHWLQCNDCGFSTPQMTSRAKAENIWGIRQPTQSDAEAMRYGFDGFGYKYIDSGSGSDWRTRHPDAEPLYLGQPTQSDALREALEAAPLIGRTESVYDFMERQDAWLKGPYRAAMQEQSK